ncbi:MOXD1 homolog 2 [Bactrocera tryoni]|uniref:MOXD1 homolog 2 n=1 Tax=Bactrocera tryoni TaxID=59916 RepID=UPI001A9988E3|nr:MOXD1 homolog 2 [Bactrocera tryoni]XP_039963294.1 MOXD1 homolog 2 [Bactrocera tryoni]XP_039963296.1 MOXD1 homolog 2 [Bactrocera tryoni]XP_039963297.1 MOXD1 homolog 2 [Bactrocera tryoni]XP_039963298.1 MOXD1 homolog 2 [Bactrocera tryoni]
MATTMSTTRKATSKATVRKEEVKHSSSSLSSLITCFISCFIVAVSSLCPPTEGATAIAAATASVTSTASATAAAAAAMTAKVATVGDGSEDSTTTIAGQGGSRLGVLSSGAVGGDGDGNALSWDHAVDLNEDFRILWTIINQDITFEIQARTLGYVGFGFSPDGSLAGSDIAIGWVDKGQTYFQDRHITRNVNTEPIVDPSQDYILMLGYENATHTVLRFRRKLDTCDKLHDISITNNTMRLIYMYHSRDPPHGSVQPGTLPEPGSAFRPYHPMVLTQRAEIQFRKDDQTRQMELRNEDVALPSGDSTLSWCKMFKLEDINRKHHLIRYEPIYDSTSSVHYLQQITLYECQGSQAELEKMAREQGRQCISNRDMPLACNAIVASWSRGSEGFTFPEDAGYPIDSHAAKYYLMETHYNNLQPDNLQSYSRQMADNSGLRIYFTHVLRPNDAGILSIGLDPNWRHIIPPGQREVISEGQCIEDCTAYAFPAQGISIFAVMMRTHQIGKKVKLRQIRQTEELFPIVMDTNIDPTYQDFRHLPAPVRSLPGDRLIAECIYDSSTRKAITLGGLTMKEESCTVLTLYYPRQKELTTCHSLPSLPTVLHSLGIEELATDSNPVLISSPPELAGMTLEARLISYDWQNQFDEFQEATRSGSFKPLCWGAKNHVIPGSEYLEGYSINITKTFKQHQYCKPKQRSFVADSVGQTDLELPVLHEMDNNNIIEGAARSSRSSAATETQGLSKAEDYSRSFVTTFWYASALLILQWHNRWSLTRSAF